MEIKIIGGHGGVTKHDSATSYLIDDVLLIDAGSVATGLDISSQLKIDHILISHAHLDHTKDLAFISDNCFGLKGRPFEVYSSTAVHKAIKDHLFNDIIWPDFSVLPSAKNPTMTFTDLEPEGVVQIGDYKVTPVPVAHPGDAFGFIIERGDCSLVFTQDTMATDRIWEIAHQTANLKAIFCEVSFPNNLQEVADLSFHHTPKSIDKEIAKMPKEVPVILGHLKPNYQDQIIQEMDALNNDRFRLIKEDQVIFNF